MNKRAFELSINFFVMLILAMAMIGYSINFLYTMFTSLSELEQKSFDDIDKQVESLTCGTQQVCLGVMRKTIARGSFKVFTVRVLNSKSGRADFNLKVEQGLKPDGASDLFFKPDSRDFTLDPGEVKSLGVGIEVPKDAASGNYVLNVNVVSGGQFYGEIPSYKIYVIVP